MGFFRKFRFYILGAFILLVLTGTIVLNVSSQSGGTTPTPRKVSTETPVPPAPTRTAAPRQPAAAATATSSPIPSATLMPSPTPSATATTPPSATATAVILPTQAAAGGTQPTQNSMPETYGFTVIFVSSALSPGGTAQATIQTVRGASCSISAYMPGENFPMVNGPAAITAGVDGVCSWYWKIPAYAKQGSGYIKIISNGMTRTFGFVIP